MILRRVMEHVKAQNWFAVGIDFVIVVVGVVIGIQVANWNEARSERAHETLLLGELRAELAESIRQTDIKRRGFEQVGRSGARALGFLESEPACSADCWSEVVDFFHASQWQRLPIELPSYDEMRRNGWPQNRQIVEAVEAFRRQAVQLAAPMEAPPAYRALVRGLIPLPIHEPYWQTCFQLVDGDESYLENCAPGVAPQISAEAIAAIRNHSDIERALTEWVGYVGALAPSLEDQNQVARRALAVIDTELVARK